MPLLIAIKQSKSQCSNGFTLIELIAVFVLISIMSLIGAPGMLGFLQRSTISSAQSEIQGLLQEAQRSSIRTSKACEVTIPVSGSLSENAANQQLTVSASCLASNASINLKEIEIRHNFDELSNVYDGTVTTAELFDFRGNTDLPLGGVGGTATSLVIVISHQSNDAFQKCIVISDGLGLIRTGNYSGDDDTTLVDTSCLPPN